MDEIFELQRQLAALQNVSTQNKLSERIVVDLIDKLIKEYDLKVYNTQDGQTLMTPNYLSQTIHQLILQQGRCQTGQLPEFIGVGVEKLESIIERDSHTWNDVVRIQDVLLSQTYITQLCEQINETLQQRQELNLSEVVTQYQLPLHFFKNYVFGDRSQNQGIIQGILAGEKLTTTCYMEIYKARLRGILIASVRPTLLTQIAKEYQFDEGIIYQICEQLIRDEQIDGKLFQGQFIPTRFNKNQENIARRFFNQNNYIEYEMLSKQLNVAKPKEFLNNLFKSNFIPLDSCGFNRQALQSIKDQLTEILTEEGYTDLQQILPTALKQSDVEQLLFKHMEIDGAELINTLIFSISHIEQLALKFKPKIVEMIYKQPQKLIETIQKEEEESIRASVGGFASKKGKKQQKPKSSKDSKSQDLFTEDEVFEYLVSIKAIEKDDALPELYQFLTPRIHKLYEQVKIELFENKTSASTELVQELQRRIEEIGLALAISVRSLEVVQSKFSQVDVRLLVDNCLYGYRLLIENIVVLICKKYGLQVPTNLFINEESLNQQLQQSISNSQSNSIEIDCAMQKATKIFKTKTALSQALEYLPKEQTKILKDLMDLCIKKQLIQLNKLFATNNDRLSIKVQLDKKTEKNFFFFIKYQNKDFIKNNVHDTYTSFIKVQELLLSDRFGIYFVGNHDVKFDKTLSQLFYEAVSLAIEEESEISPKRKDDKQVESKQGEQFSNPKEIQKLLQLLTNQLDNKSEDSSKTLSEIIKITKI